MRLLGLLMFGIALLTQAVLFSGCFGNSRSGGDANSTDNSSASSTAANATSTPNTTCLYFISNSRDYAICNACVTSLGVNATSNQIVQCVHDNLAATTPIAGSCSVPVCGPGQIVDLAACTCKDATTSTTTPTTPGQDDTLTPYLEAGFFIGNRFCAPPISGAGGNQDKLSCLKEPTNDAAAPTTFPLHTINSPANVIQDVGYVRWDLALDASQYDVSSALEGGLPFLGTSSSLSGTFSFFYRLKPNTKLSTSNASDVRWNDCIEHFSGTSASFDTNAFCDVRAAGTYAMHTDTASVPIVSDAMGGLTGTATLKNVSMNGGTANKNLTDLSTAGNDALASDIGVAKRKDLGSSGTTVTADSGLFSNIGYYKYSWGPLAVKRPDASTTDVASGTVTGRVAINTNLGYAPTSAVNSTAFSPDAVTGSVATRTCSSAQKPCVLTSVYRSTGGSVLYQSFAPQFPNNASSISSLPAGVSAVSTPKVIEDVSQFPNTNTTSPARLRVFIRGADGSIYMSRGQSNAWSTWINLGRPWTCDKGQAACAAKYFGAVPPTPRVLLPFSTRDTIDTGALGVNDGLSIAGEPVVASFMDTSVSPAKGYIAIFVRVSNLASSTGNPGPYHNAVFYTVAATNAALSTSLDFDKQSIWSQWTPVYDGANLFRIQGNPAAFMRRVGGEVVISVLGTRNTDLHPPVAPAILPAPPAMLPGWIPTGYFNYQNTLIYTSLNITALTQASFTAAMAAGGNAIPNIPAALTWNAIAAETSTAGRAFVSDWTVSDISADSFRVYATEINDLVYTDASTSLATNSGFGPQHAYSRQLHYYEYQIPAAAPNALTSLCAGIDGGFFPHLRFLGNVTPVVLTRAVNGTKGNPADVNSSTNLTFLFGRTTCTDRSKCDTVNPTAGYGVVKTGAYCPRATETTNAAGDASMYFSSFAATAATTLNPTTLTTSNKSLLQPTLVTSDVMGFYSNTLDLSSSDVPVYLFTRSPTGKMSLGTFGSSSNGASGLPFFNFTPLGGTTN